MRSRFVAALLLVSSACDAPKPAAPSPAPAPIAVDAGPVGAADPPADFAVELGSSDGPTGSSRVVGMRADGQTYARENGKGHRRAEGPVLDAATRAKLWRLVSAAKLASLGCKPDNMTEDIHVTANGASLNACTSSDANDAVGQLYRELGGFFMAASRALQAAPPDVPVPGAMVFDFVGEGRVSRVAWFKPELMPKSVGKEKRLDEATAKKLWELFLVSHVSIWLAPEILNGKRLEKPKSGCPKGKQLLRVRMDGDKTPSYVRQGCSTGKPGPEELALFDAIERASLPAP